MNLSNFTLGKTSEVEQWIYEEKGSHEVVATVLFHELGMVFRAMSGWGPSTIDLVIPYGSPVYRLSERPLSALALHTIYDVFSILLLKKGGRMPTDEWKQQTGLEDLFRRLNEQRCGFKEAGVLTGQSKRADESVTGRDCIIVNDCIHLNFEERENRVVLVDLLFEKLDEDEFDLAADKVAHVVSDAIGQNTRMKILSVEYRRSKANAIFGESRESVHVFLELDLEKGPYDERSWWLYSCHNLYFKEFMHQTADVAYKKELLLLEDPNMIGEYNWRQLAEIMPKNNQAYNDACRTFKDSKAALDRLYKLGEHPGFIAAIKAYNRPTPQREITRADVLEGMVMGWW